MFIDDCTHQDSPKCQHLPAEFFDVYRRYKISTRAVVAWLVQHGSCNCPQSNAVSVRDLKRFACSIKAKRIVMPEDILFQLRETIRARQRLSRFFMKCGDPECEQEENEAHEFFTTTLQEILQEFSHRCALVGTSKSPSVTGTSVSDEETHANRFEALNFYPTNEPIQKSTKTTPPVEKKESSSSSSVGFSNPNVIEDTIGDAASLLQIAQEMQELGETACQIWAEAARGELPAVAAAFLTNVAFSLFEDIESRFNHILGSSDPDVILLAFSKLKDRFMPETSTGVEMTFAEFETMAGLRQPWELLQQLRKARQAAQNHKPLAFETVAVNVNQVRSAPQDEVAMSTLVNDVHALINLHEVPDPVIRLSTPLYAEVGCFCTRNDSHTFNLRCAFGLRLMLETFKTQLRESKALSQKPNYRLKSLQLAQQAIKSLETVLQDPTMPCRCPQTVALALQSVQEDLQKFTRRMVFDLFFQTPWVACTHMLEIMDVMFFYGIRLVTYRHYVGSVLHVYNALQTMTEMKAIPLLDTLCSNLARVVFPGCQPKRNFRSSYTRYMGGRLNVKLHKQHHRSKNHDGTWHMTVPRDMARTASGLGMREATDDPRFDYKKLSVFYYVKEKKYSMDDHVRDQCHRCSSNSTTTSSHPCDHSQQSSTARLLSLKRTILKDFSGPLPLARTNFCAIYLACVRIVSIISDKWHEDSDAGKRCLCFVDLLLGDADTRVMNEGKVIPARYRSLWKICREAVEEVFEGRGMEEFLFQAD